MCDLREQRSFLYKHRIHDEWSSKVVSSAQGTQERNTSATHFQWNGLNFFFKYFKQSRCDFQTMEGFHKKQPSSCHKFEYHQSIYFGLV